MRGIVSKLTNTAHVRHTRCSAAERSLCLLCETSAASNMSQIQPAALPAFSGKASGGIPNLFWRRMSFDQLRAQQKYTGLPPVEQLQFASTADYRQVRQDTQLWNQLHQGLLTTGKLNAALGFYEPGAARRLGIPRDRINHGSLLSAIANLRQPAWGLAALQLPATPAERHINPAAPVPPVSAPAVTEYQAAATKLANNRHGTAVSGTNSKADKNRQRRMRRKQHQQTQQQQAAYSAAACDLASSNSTPFSVAAEPTADVYASADARRKRCIAVADRGEGGIRMAWGSAQEASALFGLMHLYPTSQLEEVGLCWVDARQQIPASWGIPLNDLPPLGASPDGLIRHKAHSAPPPPTDFPVPATLLEQAGLESHKPGLPEHTQSQQSAARNQKAAGIEGQSSNTVQTAPAVDAEFEALLTKLAVSAKQAPAWSPAQQPSHNQSSAYQQQSTLGSAAFPRQTYTANHTQTRQSSDDADQSAAQPTTAFSHDAQPEQTAARLQQPATTAAAEDVSNSMDVRQHDWFEAVEIKNVCPFRELRQTSANGKTRRVYHLSDPGPYSRVPCHFVPQLQMEMLASGAPSALVVSRSATKGMRVFRMQRHEQFLQQMLSTISQLYSRFVRADSLPPVNMFFEQAAYQNFLGTTLQVADSVQVISDLDYQALPDVHDCKMFL